MIQENVLLPLHYLMYAATWLRLLLIVRHLRIFSVTGHHMTCFYWCTCVQSWLESTFLSLSLPPFSLFLYFCRHWSHMAACLVCHSLYCLLLKSREKTAVSFNKVPHNTDRKTTTHLCIYRTLIIWWLCWYTAMCLIFEQSGSCAFLQILTFFKKFDVYQYTILMNKNLYIL